MQVGCCSLHPSSTFFPAVLICRARLDKILYKVSQILATIMPTITLLHNQNEYMHIQQMRKPPALYGSRFGQDTCFTCIQGVLVLTATKTH